MNSSLSEDRLRERLTYIRSQVKDLKALGEPATSERLADPLVLSGVIRHLQTSVEAMIDMAYHLAAKLHAREPQNAANAFEILAEEGEIPSSFLPRALTMVRLRNLVAHGYLLTERARVQDILDHDLGDFAVWERLVQAILSREGVAEDGR